MTTPTKAVRDGGVDHGVSQLAWSKYPRALLGGPTGQFRNDRDLVYRWQGQTTRYTYMA